MKLKTLVEATDVVGREVWSLMHKGFHFYFDLAANRREIP